MSTSVQDAVIAEFAPAKVNLYLQVVGRRPDGYHLLDSLVVFAGVGDTLTVAPADGLTLSVDGPTAPALTGLDDNIVLAAARRLAEVAGVRPRAAITLTKRLPVAAGIGGGSADGAAALRGLCRLWNLTVEPALLAEVGLRLGADVPVCLAGAVRQMAGVGEVLTPAPALPPTWLVLVNPRQGLSTPAVFKARQGPFSAPRPLDRAPVDAADLAREMTLRTNDLAPPAVELLPVIADVLAALAGQAGCLLPRMSGSGATCFGLFADETTATRAAEMLGHAHPGWWVAPAPIL